ncbi:MAG TPA: PAS domain S-box protein [Acidimicrobiia bacterium]|jgi:diguanylate cyclase (GGDEF)-like protein/PAS domain S-box-containing protein
MQVFDAEEFPRPTEVGSLASARARAVFDTLGEGLIIWGEHGEVLDLNRSAAEILGRSQAELMHMTFDETMQCAEVEMAPVTEDGAALEQPQFPAVRARRENRPVVGKIMGITRPDGERVWLEVDVRPVYDEFDGKLLVTSFRDITERKAAEDRAGALSAIVESSSDAVYRMTLDGIIESWNPGAERLYGYLPAEAIGAHHDMLVPDDQRIEAEHLVIAAASGTSINNLLTVRRRKDGTLIHVVVTASPLHDSGGHLVGVSEIAGDVTELIAARDALALSEERFRSLVQRSSDVAFVIDEDGCITYASPASERFGYTPEDLIGTASRDLIHPDDLARHRDTVDNTVQRIGTATVEWRLRRADGSYCWVEEVFTDLHDVPAVGGWIANMRDITDRREAEEERIEAEERYRQGFERSAFGLGVLDLGQTFTSVNPALAELLGHTPELLLGRRPMEFLHPTESESARSGIERLLRGDVPFYKREHRMVRRDGSIVSVLIDMTLVRDSDGDPGYYFVQVRDITDRKRAEEALAHQALHDDLTHLPNRLLLVDRLAHSLARAERTGSNVAVLFLDLDRFKLVNDGLGHVVGDQLLVEVAHRLTQSIRASDTVARFGGDEFVIVREDIADVTEAVEFAERIVSEVHEPIALSGRELYATTSVGIALGGAEASAEQLLRDADAAMYRAKDLGRARIELFSHELQQQVAARLDLETALRQAIERDELELLYQPIVRLADGRVVGAEALLRWHRAGHGVVLPSEFIPIAEETGMIVAIGTWALEHALAELRALTRMHDVVDWPLLAVNLSALQLRLPTSLEMVREAIRASGVDPSMLALEITESALMDDIETSARAMHSLRELGVKFAVDDFGTGYSSLAYLKQLPVDCLKIDRSFIAGLPGDQHDRSITQAIITLGNSLGLTIVAEGVETVEQWIALDELGCTVGQGFLWSPPIPASSFAPLITGLRRRTAPKAANAES